MQIQNQNDDGTNVIITRESRPVLAGLGRAVLEKSIIYQIFSYKYPTYLKSDALIISICRCTVCLKQYR